MTYDIMTYYIMRYDIMTYYVITHGVMTYDVMTYNIKKKCLKEVGTKQKFPKSVYIQGLPLNSILMRITNLFFCCSLMNSDKSLYDKIWNGHLEMLYLSVQNLLLFKMKKKIQLQIKQGYKKWYNSSTKPQIFRQQQKILLKFSHLRACMRRNCSCIQLVITAQISSSCARAHAGIFTTLSYWWI